MENDFILELEVGKEMPDSFLPKGYKKDVYKKDFAILNAMEYNQGYAFIIGINEPKSKEIRVISRDLVRMRIYKDEDSRFVLPMLNFGNNDLIFEMYFDATIYEDDRALQMLGKNNMLSIYLVDTSDFKLKAMRQVNLPYLFIKEVSEIWKRNILNDDEYDMWYKNSPRQKSLHELWYEAQDVGYLGETMTEEQLEELKNMRRQ